jgi:hypothetical protein
MQNTDWKLFLLFLVETPTEPPMPSPLVSLYPSQYSMKRNNLVRTLPMLSKEYAISFQVYPTAYLKGKWGSVIHLSISDNIDVYGSRIPGIWFSPNPVGNTNSIVPANALNGKKFR